MKKYTLKCKYFKGLDIPFEFETMKNVFSNPTPAIKPNYKDIENVTVDVKGNITVADKKRKHVNRNVTDIEVVKGILTEIVAEQTQELAEKGGVTFTDVEGFKASYDNHKKWGEVWFTAENDEASTMVWAAEGELLSQCQWKAVWHDKSTGKTGGLYVYVKDE